MIASRKVRIVAYLIRRIPRRIRGRWRLARLLIGNALNETGITLDTLEGHKLDVPCLREPVAFSILVDGTYEPETWATIEAYLPRNGVFIDVGANVGFFSLKAARHVGERGKVIAIEASEKIFRFLERNVASSNYSNIICMPVAACEHDGVELAFYDAPDSHFGMGSLAPQFSSPARNVTGRTLDSIITDLEINRVDVIKVDVEGFEASVFLGAKQLLTGIDKPIVIFEFLDWAEERAGFEVGQAQLALAEFGYDLKLIGRSPVSREHLERPLRTGGAMLIATPGKSAIA